MFSKLKSQLKSKVINWLGGNNAIEDLPGVGSSWDIGGIMGCYRNGSYDNNFPNITRIAESFAEVAPYAVDAKGEILSKQPHLIDVLNNPNKNMSGPDFWETLIVMMLVHPTVYLLCWHKEGREIVAGGKITPENIAAFTFLEGVGITRVNGKATYYCGGNTYSEDEVIALSLNVNPYDLLAGYSPSQAAKKWATVDDYVADYQAGHFRNGAVPAGQFVVTARTKAEFNAIVDEMQANHRGATNANNPIYVHRPVSSIDDKPLGAQIEWVPYAQTTEKGTLQSIFDQANKKIDMDFGVPQEVKGYLQNSNYASAEVADYIFSRRVIYPKLRKVYSKFTHEMNRITGGLRFALSFDYELPVLTEVKTAQVEALQTVLSQGFSLDSAVDALQLPSSFKKLQKDKASTDTQTPIANSDTVDVAADANDAKKGFKAKAINDEEETGKVAYATDERLYKILQNFNEEIIAMAIALVKSGSSGDLHATITASMNESKLVERTTRLIVAVLIAIMLERGQEVAREFAEELGLDNLNMDITEEQVNDLSERISDLLQKFADQTITEILNVVTMMPDGGADDETLRRLAELRITDEYRYERWAISERYEAEQEATLIAAIIAGDKADLVSYKTWQIDPTSQDLCADCLRMDGETVRADQPFSNGDMVPHYHPFCRCKARYTWRRAEKSLKITCPKCGRYMMESTGGSMKNVICANGKCKKHYDIEVSHGEVKFREREKS